MRPRFPFLLSGLAIAVVAVAISTARASEPRDLAFLNWGEYMDPALIEAFEKQHNARVKEVFFENEEDRNRLLLESGGTGYDVVVVSGLEVASYRHSGWLSRLDDETVPNLKHIAGKWRTIYPAADGFAAPFFWGTLGIAYRADLVPEGVRSWKQFFAPDEAIRGKIATTGDARDLIGMALKCLGYSPNSTAPAELAAAEDLIIRQKPFVRTRNYLSLGPDSALVTGDVIVSMMYNGDAFMVAEHNTEITYVVPEEGGNLWVDYLVVLEGSKNKELARAFVNFLNEPANAAQLAQYVYYATPNTAAEALLTDEFLHDPVIYPPGEVIDRSEIFKALPARAERRRAMIYARIAG